MQKVTQVRRPLTFITLVMVASSLGAAAPEAPGPSVILPLYLHRDRPLAMLTIGGHLPSPIIFDTGTDENIVSKSLASEYKLKQVGTSPLLDLGTGKSTTVPTVALPDPRLGGVPLSITIAQVLDRKVPDEVGIFGPYSFGDNYVVLEAGLNRIRLVPRNSGLTLPGPGIPYEGNLPSMPIRVGELMVNAHLDSGNSDPLVLGEDMMKTVPLKEPAQIVGIAVSALGEKEVYGGRLQQAVKVGPITLDQPEVTFSGRGDRANVGFPVIRRLTIVLDPTAKRSWVLDAASERADMAIYAGQFDNRTLTNEGGKLFHQRQGRPKFELRYLGGDLFENPGTGDRIQFFRSGGRVNRLELLTTEGDVVEAKRTL
jgi:hypothetical protein